MNNKGLTIGNQAVKFLMINFGSLRFLLIMKYIFNYFHVIIVIKTQLGIEGTLLKIILRMNFTLTIG